MARKRMVTRTIRETTVTAMVCNVLEGKVEMMTLSLGGNVEEGTELKIAQKMYDTAEEKVVSIQNVKVTEYIYGMLESDFLKYASKMDGDRKFLD